MNEKRAKASWWLRLWSLLVIIWLIAPVLVIIPLGFSDAQSFKFPPDGWSLRWYAKFFSDPAWSSTLLNSLLIAFLVMIVTTVVGTAAAYALDRGNLPGKNVISALLLAPMIVPGIVTAVALLGVFIRWNLTGTLLGFVLAHTMIALPFTFVAVMASLRSFDRRLERVSISLGGGPWYTFRRVTLPLVMPGVLSGAVFAFVTSLDEVVIALYLQTPDLRTLPVQMFNSVTIDVDPTIASASTIILVVTTAAILIPQLVKRDKVASKEQ